MANLRYYVDQAGLQLTEIFLPLLLSLPLSAGIKDMCHHSWTKFFKVSYFWILSFVLFQLGKKMYDSTFLKKIKICKKIIFIVEYYKWFWENAYFILGVLLYNKV